MFVHGMWYYDEPNRDKNDGCIHGEFDSKEEAFAHAKDQGYDVNDNDVFMFDKNDEKYKDWINPNP